VTDVTNVTKMENARAGMLSPYIHDCLVHDVLGCGPNTVEDQTAHSVNSGHGIRANCSTGLIIERCVAHDLGLNYGNLNVAIWFYECTDSICRDCEAYNIFRGVDEALGSDDYDSGGFDCDGGNQGCIVERCYAHDCHGPAFIYAHFNGASRPTSGNVARFLVGINNGKSASGAKESAGQFWTDYRVALNSGLKDNLQHNCTFIDRAGDLSFGLSGGTTSHGQILGNCVLWSDRVTTGKPTILWDSGTLANQTVRGNIYWDVDASGATLKLDNTDCTTIAAAQVLSHETFSAELYGQIISPAFTFLPVTAPTVTISGRPGTGFPAAMRAALSSGTCNVKNTAAGVPATAAALNEHATLYATSGTDFFGAAYSAPFVGVAVP